jgi:negative regulator of sigma E activity
MTAHTPNPINPSNVGSLMRAAADNELTADQQKTLDLHLESHPEDESRVAFEQSLRQAVSRSMQSERAPAGLAATVQAALRSDAHDARDEADHDVPLVETIAHTTRQRSFWSSIGGRLAVAAAVLLTFTAGWYAFTQLNPTQTNTWGAVNRVQLASFLSEQHVMCGNDPDFAAKKFTVTDVSEIQACFDRVIGKAPQLEQIFEQGGDLVGLGECGVPGPGKSVHMQVLLPIGDANDPGQIATQTTISLFIQQGLDRSGIDPGTPYTLEEGQDKGYAVDVWERDGLIYYLVCDTPEAAQAARNALKIAEPNQSL